MTDICVCEFPTTSARGPTTTIDESTGLRIGIHVDNFDKLSFDQRDAGRRLVGKRGDSLRPESILSVACTKNPPP